MPRSLHARLCRLVFATGFIGLFVPVPEAMAQFSTGAPDLTDLSLEELGALSISAASKRRAPLFETAAAVSVLRGEDLRRAGIDSAAEALRLLPGVHVAQNDTARWSVGVRGFNGVTSTKLLVLVDGRTVYSPYYAGVNWTDAGIAIDDLSQIEVVRGPGATLWGANAVNGIVNVLSKDAGETQGGLLAVRGSSAEGGSVYARWGGNIGSRGWFRVYAHAQETSHALSTDPAEARRNLRDVRTGFRFDGSVATQTRATLQGEFSEARFASPAIALASGDAVWRRSELARSYLLGRVVRRSADGDELTVQMYVDYVDGTGGPSQGLAVAPGSGVAEDGYSIDLDVTQSVRWGERHALVWGGGVRRTALDVDLDPTLQVEQPKITQVLYNLFVQDEFTLVPERWRVTFGSKVEHHEPVGWQFLPSARLTFTPDRRQTWWGAVSRAVRSPSQAERDSRLIVAEIPPGPMAPPVQVAYVGNAGAREEVLVATEVGWRYRPSPRLVVDVAAYLHEYDALRDLQAMTSFQPSPPLVRNDFVVVNNLAARGYGMEAAVTWRVRESWQLAATCSLQRLAADRPVDPAFIGPDFSVPREMFSVRSWWELPHDFEFSCAAYHVAKLPLGDVPAYTRLDAQLTWRPRLDLEFGVGVQNAAAAAHVENSEVGPFATVAVKRNVFAHAKWRF